MPFGAAFPSDRLVRGALVIWLIVVKQRRLQRDVIADSRLADCGVRLAHHPLSNLGAWLP
jgi:hypothetical protein